jgi:UDP-N-acetylglucosamine 3-dehydrogenase
MNIRKVNVGVVGVGYWGKKILDEYSRIDAVDIDGVSDLDEANLLLCAQKYGITNGYKDYEQLLARMKLDAVSICVPNAQHYRIVRAALDAGKHVLVEKPFTLSSKEGSELIEIARRKRLTLSVGHIFRFNNALAKVRRLIREKDYFGRIYLVEMSWGNREPPFPDRDIIWDQGPHIFDIQNYLMDDWPIELNCLGGAFRRNTGEESAYIGARYKNGAITMAAISWLVARKTRQISLTGELRSAQIDAVDQKLTIYERGSAKEIAIQSNNTIRDELIYFIESMGKPDREPINRASIGVKTVELIEAAKKSIAEKRTIKLEGMGD